MRRTPTVLVKPVLINSAGTSLTLLSAFMIASTALASMAIAGDASVLTGTAIHQAVAGKTVHLDTPYGAIPIVFREDGSISGTAGRLAQYTGSANDNGKWWVVGNKLCQKWSLWLEAKTNCMTVRQDGTRVEWTSSNGTTGSATITQ
jgi:hypothetical protein